MRFGIGLSLLRGAAGKNSAYLTRPIETALGPGSLSDLCRSDGQSVDRHFPRAQWLALLVVDSARPVPRRRGVLPCVPDWLPALFNAGRAFVAVGAVELFWILTAWPNGARAITFAAIGVILLAPRADQAYAAAVSFMLGTGLTAIFAAIIAFAVLPNTETFAAFSLAIGLVLVPAGAGMAQPWQTPMFTAMAVRRRIDAPAHLAKVRVARNGRGDRVKTVNRSFGSTKGNRSAMVPIWDGNASLAGPPAIRR